jgi:hypothetical protein
VKSGKLHAFFVVLLLAVWLVTPALAFAQDETPPEGTPTETPTEVQTDTPPDVSTETPVDMPTEAVTEVAPEVTVEEAQAQLPEDTQLVLINGDGMEVPLDSPEGDAILASGDPVYCPCGAPLGDASCGPVQGTLALAIADAQADTTCSWGVIYVESTYVGAPANNALVIDADDFFWGDSFTLYVYGGIDFNSANPTYGQTIGTSTLQQPLTIRDFDSGWGSVSLYDFIINPPATATNNALNIVNSEDTDIENCSITDNTNYNAVRVDNSDYTNIDYCTITDNLNGSAVQVQNGSDNFYIGGGTITESGAGNGITITDSDYATLSVPSIVESGDGHGINLDNAQGAYLYGYGTTITESDGGSGIRVANGSDDAFIYYPTVNESGDDNGIVVNGSNGVEIYAATVHEADAGTGIVVNNGSSDISLEWNTVYEHGAGNGVNIVDSSSIDSWGGYVEEHDDGNGMLIDNSATINAYYPNITEYDDGSALRIQNGANGVMIDSPYIYEYGTGSGINATNSSNILIQDYGSIYEYDGNPGLHADGVTNLTVDILYLYSYNNGDAALIENSDTIDLNGLYAFGGTNASGLYFDSNTGPLTITNSESFYNADYGIYITGQTGNMLLDDVYAYDNGNSGLEVHGSTGDFSILNSTLSWNGWNGSGNGFNVVTTGDVNIDNVTSEYNVDYNGYLDVSGNVTAANSTFYNSFNESGLEAWLGGTFTATGSDFNNNEVSGLYVDALGDINLDYVTASYNYDSHGAWLDAGGDITVSHSTFNHNYNGAGLVAGVNSGQTTYVRSSTANYNEYDGFALFGDVVVTALGLTMIGNVDSGLYVNNPPAVPVNVFASGFAYNGLWGIDYNAGTGTLTLCGDYYTNNPAGQYGVGVGATVYDYASYPCANPGTGGGGAGGVGASNNYGITTAGGPGGTISPTGNPVIVEVPYVADFTTEHAQAGSSIFDTTRGLIFELMETLQDNTQKMWAEASIPAGLVPDGSQASFLQIGVDELPATLPNGSTFVGPAFTLGFTGVTQTSGNIEIKFLLPTGLTVPAGQSLAIVVYGSAGNWATLPTDLGTDYATANTNVLGTFALVLVTP